MSLTKTPRNGVTRSRHGVPANDRQDPIGFAVAMLNRLAQTSLLDRLGLRKQTERVVFETTRAGFRTGARSVGRSAAGGGQGVTPSASPRPRPRACST